MESLDYEGVRVGSGVAFLRQIRILQQPCVNTAAGEGVCHGALGFEQAEPSGVTLLHSLSPGCIGAKKNKSVIVPEILRAFLHIQRNHMRRIRRIYR